MNSDNNLIKIIADTCAYDQQEKSYFEILLDGLEGFLKFPGCREAALFLIENETFDFYLKLVVPWRDENAVNLEFSYFTDSGIIADVLTSGKVTIVAAPDDPRDAQILIVPMIDDCVYGLVILHMEEVFEPAQLLHDALHIYTKQYTYRVLLSKQRSTNKYLEENMKQIASVSASHFGNSDVQLLDFLDKFPIGIFLVRKSDGVILSANVSASIAIGTTKQDIISRNIDEFIFKARTINRGDIVTQEESVIRKKNGSLLSIHYNRTEITLGRDTYWLDIFIDITERKYLESKLQKIREELEQRVEERTLKLKELNEALRKEVTERAKAESDLFKFYWAVQQNPVMIILTDKDGNIEYVNPQFCERTGHKFNEVIGENVFKLVNIDQETPQFKEFLNVVKTKLSWRGQHKTQRKNGEKFWVESIVSPVVNFEGEIKNFVAVQEDITMRRMTEEQMVIAKEKAEEADKLKTNILANMSHEFRTPLISILGFSKLMSEEVGNDDFRMMSDNIFSAGNRLLRTLNNVLFLAQVDTDRSNYTSGSTEVNEQVNKVVGLFRAAAEEKGLKISAKVSDEPFLVYSPVEFPELLMSQLVDNAIKFTKDGSVEVVTEIDHEAGIGRIEVIDTGIGIGTDFQKTIFQPFHQESAGYGRIFEGSGLGLSVAMKITESLSGKLELQSSLGAGAKFIITLPLLKTADNAAE